MKPSDFFIGIIDFLAVLLPGSAAAFLLKNPALAWLQLDAFPVADSEGWIAFAFSAYLLGQIIFLIGSALDRLYDRRRKRIKPVSGDKTFQAADGVRQKTFPELGDGISTFKWAKAFLQLHAPAARAEVDQLEATSKFFRSVTVLFALGAPCLIVAGRPALAAAAAALSYACFHGFYDHRWKCTELAYTYAVLITGEQSKPTAR